MAVDPVCGLEVIERKTNPLTQRFTFGANIYFFCSVDCREEFETDPSYYTDPAYYYEAAAIRRIGRLSLNLIMSTSVKRTMRWHKAGVSEWSALEWAGAMMGEQGELAGALLFYLAKMTAAAGEAANAAKKLRRLELGNQNINEEGRHIKSLEEARAKIGQEFCDVILYGVLLASRAGITDLEAIMRKTFNDKSEEYGFPERL